MSRVKNLSGMQFSHWKVIQRAANDSKGRAKWLCECVCGKRKSIAQFSLCRGGSKSCGCRGVGREFHGASGGKSLEYLIWKGIKKRCRNHPHYAGRGITICKKWETSFLEFIKDMGPRPSRRHSIERINNDGNYEPNNCRWATQKEQGNNRRTNLFFTVDGETATMQQHCEKFGVKPPTVHLRLKAGVPPQFAFKPNLPRYFDGRWRRFNK